MKSAYLFTKVQLALNFIYRWEPSYADVFPSTGIEDEDFPPLPVFFTSNACAGQVLLSMYKPHMVSVVCEEHWQRRKKVRHII